MSISVVVTCFNRAWCIERALLSARKFIENFGDGQLVIIDDGSTDGSLEIIDEFKEKTQISFSTKVHKFKENTGVTSAKNKGVDLADCEWILFLDSDDELLPESAKIVKKNLQLNEPLVFFNAIVAGSRFTKKVPLIECRDLSKFVIDGTGGDCLPVILSRVKKEFPFDNDLPGFERISYLRIIAKYGFAKLVHDVALLIYDKHPNRLSSKLTTYSRSVGLAVGYYRSYIEFRDRLSYHAKIITIIKMMWNYGRGVVYNFFCYLKIT